MSNKREGERMNDDMQTKLDEIEAEAEKLAAGIYGIPELVKCFTVDLHLGAIQRYERKVHLNLEYKAGFIAGANHVLEELKTERAKVRLKAIIIQQLQRAHKAFSDQNDLDWKDFRKHAEDLRADLARANTLIDTIGGHCTRPDSAEGCRVILKKIWEHVDGRGGKL